MINQMGQLKWGVNGLAVASILLLVAGCGDSAEVVEETGEAIETPDVSEAPAVEAPAVETPEEEAPAAPQDIADIPHFNMDDAIAGEWRPEEHRARDQYRHPKETLGFFGLEPGMTVVEIWPGGGWYTNILAPYVSNTGGTYIAAGSDASGGSDSAVASVERFQRNFVDEPQTYGPIEVTSLGGKTDGIAPAGSADLVLTFRNVHNWVSGGMVEKGFADAFNALKPGGVLGVIDHRLPADREQDEKASTGYLHESFVVAAAEAAGFAFVGGSDINNNPKDTGDHPFGVWTLPPTKRTASYGAEADPNFDQTPYVAIGESDRFTLKFRKPAAD